LGGGIESLTKFHDVDTALAQGWTHRRAWIRLPGRNLKLDFSYDLLSHLVDPSGESA
jgi:hypothetical protein